MLKEKPVNDLCLRCQRDECPGICDEMKADMGQIDMTNRVHTLTWHGITRSIAAWALILDIPKRTIYYKLNQGLDLDQILEKEFKNDIQRFPPYAIEETYSRISTMHNDYLIYWKMQLQTDGSHGMVSRYSNEQTGKTNKPSNPVEARALPELTLSDEALYRRGWVAATLYIIEHYRSIQGDRREAALFKAKTLEYRAIEGMTLQKIMDRLNEGLNWKNKFTMNKLRKVMKEAVLDLTAEAMKRGILRAAQK